MVVITIRFFDGPQKKERDPGKRLIDGLKEKNRVVQRLFADLKPL
jgi:hypothetical protein